MEALSDLEEIVGGLPRGMATDARTQVIEAASPTRIRQDAVAGMCGKGRAMTQIEEVCQRLSERGNYSARFEHGNLRIRDSEIGSEYILQMFDMSVQIRQAVWLDCNDLPEDDLSRIYMVCSMINERFSGCKSYVDQWGALIIAADILGPDITIDFIEIVLNQVEFMSQAMERLVEVLRSERRLVTEEEIDSALDVPPLQ